MFELTTRRSYRASALQKAVAPYNVRKAKHITRATLNIIKQTALVLATVAGCFILLILALTI